MKAHLGRVSVTLATLASLIACRPIVGAEPEAVVIPHSRFVDKLKGGWAGQMIGVSYGSIYEFKALGKTLDAPLREWKPEFVDNTIDQDDLYVEMTFLETLQKHGIDPSNQQVGEAFRDSKYRLWHANMAGRVNLRAGIMPPDSGHPRYNPHSDDIDFQIESDLFGLIAPGLFQASARLCDRFGSVMNYGDGLYGGRFTAAMYAQAYLEKDVSPEALARCVETGLKAIPPESQYARAIEDVLACHRADPANWRAAWKLVEDKWGQQDTCPDGEGNPFNIDAKVNGAYVVIGLLFGAGDFDRTLEIATRCGQDADCNPSSAAGVLGTLVGYDAIPGKFTQGIPALTGRNFSYTSYDFPSLLAACESVTRKILASEGGTVENRGGEEVFLIPRQSPAPPEKVQKLEDFSKQERQQWRQEFDDRARQQNEPHR